MLTAPVIRAEFSAWPTPIVPGPPTFHIYICICRQKIYTHKCSPDMRRITELGLIKSEIFHIGFNQFFFDIHVKNSNVNKLDNFDDRPKVETSYHVIKELCTKPCLPRIIRDL